MLARSTATRRFSAALLLGVAAGLGDQPFGKFAHLRFPAESCDLMMKYARDPTSVCLNGATSAPD
jgi:hypothetical protein